MGLIMKLGDRGLPLKLEKCIHENVDISVGQRGGYNSIETHCACCGKPVYIPVPHEWAYKIKIRKPNGDRFIAYYHSYSCYMEGRNKTCNIVKGFIWK